MNELVYRNETTLRTIALVLSIIMWAVLLVGTFGALLAYILLIALFALAAHSALIAHLRGNAIRITPKQMPDLCQRIYRCARKLNIDDVPEAYLVNGNGVLNAFATRFLGRSFVVLLSDVVDSMEDRPGALDFYIGHELGHLRRHHLTWSKILAPALFLPLLGAAYSRAREYTCDRHGLAVCDNPEDAQYGLVALAAGKRRWRAVDLDEYSNSAAAQPGFWMSLHELVGDYPWLSKRHAWLRALAQQRKPKLGQRNAFAYAISLLLPRIPGLGMAGGAIVICYVAILAAIAIPAYQNYVERATVTFAMSESAPYRQAIEQYSIGHQQWPASWQQLGVARFPGNQKVESIELEDNGALAINFTQLPLRGHVLLLTPYSSAGAIRWSCGGTVPATVLPLECHAQSQQPSF
ncbi:M48 family metallopeptidase [Dyella mobilis]|uniref:M48 family metalloprotease n=1 Tax=Dyella mobilis TaxID=1849582 RepID=A0ABS2KIT6_9GAMM|nr:M48 family metallopeptidase [Dyella mobilis]MBM7131077.1 M48 family metalloprotease [Dyella mobilis]GLQ97704.1 peptidase M48 [Dyella mobilis]